MQFQAKDGEATIWIYDAIGEMFGPDAITAKGVRDRLGSLRGIDRLTVRINSPGGMVDDAIAIHTLLSEYDAEKTVKVDGVAASAASVIAMVGKRIEMATGSMLMVHNPWGVAIGDGDALRKAAEVADKYRDSLIAIYAKRTGADKENIASLMSAETWFTAEEAIAGKWADDVTDGEEVQAFIDTELFPYKHTPAAMLKALLKQQAPAVNLRGYRVALAKARQSLL